MTITPDSIVIASIGEVRINATLFYTWLIMAILVIASWLITRRLSIEGPISRRQNFLEVVVDYIRGQIREIVVDKPEPYIAFLGSLFLFISISNFLSFVPVYHAPTGSLYTTSALALCVFLAVPFFGVRRKGVRGYLKHYVEPSIVMLPFNIISEFSRTLALAVRLFGNVMSGTLITAVLLSFVPLFVPVIMHLFELLIGQIHAYIFAVLATVYIASSTRIQEQELHNNA
mgnify:CR=1 FL=1